MAEPTLFWAKTNDDHTRYHSLLFHMLDVAAVAGQVWDNCLPTAQKSRLTSCLGSDVRNMVVFLAGAHDIGKATPAFQTRASNLKPQTLPYSQNDRKDVAHGKIGAYVLKEFLGNCQISTLLGQIIGGHHGVFPRSYDLQLGVDTLGNDQWRCARNNLLNEFARTVGFYLDEEHYSNQDITDPFILPVLAGLVSVVDWIGSNQDFFRCACANGEKPTESAVEYWRRAQDQAVQALTALGWLPAAKFAKEASFNRIFPNFTANSLQIATANLIEAQTAHYMMIIEAPMGLGKTEAALYAADLALSRGFARGMYIAMPTQATSNAMFQRVLDSYLRNRGHTGKLNLQLVHGDALLAQTTDPQEGEITEFKPSYSEANKARREVIEDGLEAQSWFTARKRPFLAPFGVGTIDQSLLSVLQTKHWFVRLFGLASKVVIFDEVHAYDAYMSTILERLLQWLAELDCTVILLSATLPEAKRKALLKAYSGCEDFVAVPYPRISLGEARHLNDSKPSAVKCVQIPSSESRTIKLQFLGTDLDCLAALLSEKLVNGGCAAVICNTVDRSIEVYNYLRGELQGTECYIFHARTPKMWRREREEEVLRKFGKGNQQADGTYFNPDRPERAVLVATQVIEQSLDLDLDLMVSEIAPIDLLLQRAGRLHRHPRSRPQGLELPQFILLCDAARDGLPPDSFGEDIEYVYDRYILLRTWLAIRGKGRLDIPTEVESLIESVYGLSEVAPLNWKEQVQNAKEKMEFEHSESEKAACRLLVSEPNDPSELIEQFNQQLADDEDPEVHKSVRAATREGDPSITVVFLPADEQLSDNPQFPEVRRLLDYSAKVSRRGLFKEIRDNAEQPKEWAKNAHLRHTRLLRLDEHSRSRIGKYILEVNSETGITIVKEGDINV